MVLLLIWVFCFGKVRRWESYHLIQWDIFEYYSYLPATFIKHDLSLKFLDSEKEDSHWKNLWTTPQENGKHSVRMTMGLSFLYLPFFLVAHITAGWLGYARDGFTLPYQAAIAFSCVFYAFIGLCVLRKILLKYFDEVITSVSLAVLVFGTNLWSGTLFEPGLTHPYLLMLISIFLYLTIKWIEKPNYKIIIAAGFTAGWIVLIRPTDIIVLLVPLLFGILSWKQFAGRLNLFWKHKLHMVVFGFCLFLVFVPQLLYWKYISGHWIMYSYGVERFYFLKPHLLSGLFSYRKGWLLYTPVMALALIGIFLLRKFAKDLFWLLLIFTLLNTWVLLSWWCWWYGGCFGMRPMIESYALMVFPLAAFIRFVWEKKNYLVRSALAVCLGFFVWLNLFQSNQYSISVLHYECTSKELYLKAFGSMQYPANYEKLLKCPEVEKGGWEEDSHIEKIWN